MLSLIYCRNMIFLPGKISSIHSEHQFIPHGTSVYLKGINMHLGYQLHARSLKELLTLNHSGSQNSREGIISSAVNVRCIHIQKISDNGFGGELAQVLKKLFSGA